MLNKDIFIDKSIQVHGNKYDYSKVEYRGMINKVVITCQDHGDFEQKASNHVKGQGCPNCSFDSRCERNRRSYKQFIDKSIQVHGNKYDYSKVEYRNSLTKVCIICPEHGEFWQTPSNHLRGYRCKRCGMENRRR